MRIVNTEEITNCVYRLALKAGRTLTDSCRVALANAAKEETGAAQFALNALLQNEVCAKRENMPICQDTGMSVVLLQLGQEVFLEGKPLIEAVDEGVRRAYADGYFRKSICDPLTRKNTGDNTPAYLHTEIVAGEKIFLTFLPKGFGSENMSALKMLTPADGVQGIINFVVETVQRAGSRPCPPVYVGVGIGGSFDGCALLAKKALTREVGSANPRADIAALEQEMLNKINELGIGAQGFGGKVSAIGVSCEVAPTHIAGLPVAVNMQCHCVRCEKEVL